MTVKELRDMVSYDSKPPEMSNEQWDEMLVMMPLPDSMEKEFITPCSTGTGIDELEMVNDDNNIEIVFLIVPQGYDEPIFDPSMN